MRRTYETARRNMRVRTDGWKEAKEVQEMEDKREGWKEGNREKKT